MTSDEQRTLFNQLGIEYLESNRYLPVSLARRDVRRTLYYRRNRLEFEELAGRYGEALRRGGWERRLEIRHIGGPLGFGLFAAEAIPAGDLAGEYTGVVRRARRERPLPAGGFSTDYAWGFPEVRNFALPLEIDAREAGGLLRFVNHSGRPNCEPDHFALDGRWRLVFVACLPIAAGDELTIDYGDAYWTGGARELVVR
jgi:hypothetical protein